VFRQIGLRFGPIPYKDDAVQFVALVRMGEVYSKYGHCQYVLLRRTSGIMFPMTRRGNRAAGDAVAVDRGVMSHVTPERLAISSRTAGTRSVGISITV